MRSSRPHLQRLLPFCAIGVLAASLFAASPARGLEFLFDYSYDSNGFFDDPQRRELLELAARHVNRYIDRLEPIVPTAENSWFTFPPLPPGGSDTTLLDLQIPADTLHIIVGGNNILPVATLSQTNVSPASPWPLGGGTPEWKQLLESRGQAGALASRPTDVGNWGGVMMFNGDDIQWHFGLTTDGLAPEETDFLTVAMHELMHILGFGPADSFQTYIVDSGGLKFNGPEALSVGSIDGSPIPLNDGGHWAEGTFSTVANRLQEAIMGPIIAPGERRFPTLLDRAALRDVGWQEAATGDANLDRQFDMLDIVMVGQLGKYLTGQTAVWDEGDWNGDLRFDQKDIVAALSTGLYLTGPYAAHSSGPSGGALVGDVRSTSITGDLFQTELVANPMHGSALGDPSRLGTLHQTFVAVPEPASITLSAIATIALALAAWRMRTQSSHHAPKWPSRSA